MKPVQVIAVSGGKGGVGKTNVSVNLSLALAQLNRRVVLMDADLGLANVDLQLGITPQKNLFDVISGDATWLMCWSKPMAFGWSQQPAVSNV